MSPGLGPGPEFDRIRAIARALGHRADPGLGDDCALVEWNGGFLAASSDLSIENVHFRRDWLAPEEIGWRAAASALSDLAAVGAEPIGLLASLALPADDADAAVVVMAGIGQAAELAGTTVLGGDLSRGPAWVVDITVLGRVMRPVRRSGAAPGDTVWVTGALGGARAALVTMEKGEPVSIAHRESFVRPVPRIAAGQELARLGATAMIDLSDGLAGDAGHLAAASAVRIEMVLDRVPLAPGLERSAELVGEDPRRFVARGGEDYELLFTLPGGADPGAVVAGLPVTRIGTVSAGEGTRLLLEGREVNLSSFDHFR